MRAAVSGSELQNIRFCSAVLDSVDGCVALSTSWFGPKYLNDYWMDFYPGTTTKLNFVLFSEMSQLSFDVFLCNLLCICTPPSLPRVNVLC